jgi:NTP pyrophosphatase (non-canonical NTP hydrolase)
MKGTVNMNKFLKRVEDITQKDLAKNHSRDILFRHLVEEVGEYANAVTVEEGIKVKELKESSKVEAVDVVICALSIYFASGGTMKELVSIGNEKLNKWELRV